MKTLAYESHYFTTDVEPILFTWAEKNLKDWKTKNVISYQIYIDVTKGKAVFTWTTKKE